MRILRAKHLGLCFGVRTAIALAERHAARAPLTILGDLVHNDTVLAGLAARGIRLTTQLAAVSTPTVMITAHGASERTLGQLHERGLAVVEATCPLVRQAQQVVKRLAREGYHPIIIGQRQHVEVRGLTEDLAEFDVVQTEAEVAALAARPRFGIAAQTTQPIEKVLRLRVLLQQRFPSAEFRFVDTVCQHTKQRQQAAVELARQCEVVMVIGGAHSNNTRELVATCRQYCAQVYHVQTAEDVCLEWLAGAETVGFTAGTSTPDHVIEGVAARLQEAAEVVAEETVAA